MNAVELIERKRDRGALTADQIRWFIAGVADGKIPDYQAAAMLMAVFINGMDPDELATWTDAMLHSGEVLDLSSIEAPKADKHSTGGVGDKVSIPLAPIVAVCGAAVPMMSGRGLGHTGGTLDKLESIPGFTTALDPDRFDQDLGYLLRLMPNRSRLKRSLLLLRIADYRDTLSLRADAITQGLELAPSHQNQKGLG